VLLLLACSLNAQNSGNEPTINHLKDFTTPITKFLPQGFAQGTGFFTTFDSDDGLAMDAVGVGDKSALCDSYGNLWFGTSGGGISKYDGKYFTTYSTGQGLINNIVRSTLEDKAGNLWFGTSGGVSKYNGESFTNYSSIQGLGDNRVMSILEDKNGNIWFATYGGGVSKFNGIFFTTYSTEQGLANNVVLSILEDKKGNIWFGTYDGLSRYNGESFTTFRIEEGLSNNTIYSITEDKKGILWFATSKGGVSKYDGKSFTIIGHEEEWAKYSVRSITEDKMGNLWFGTFGGGVSKYDGKSFTTYITDQGLSNNMVLSITEDKKGNLWFGTYGGGISKYSGKSFISYNIEQGLANNMVLSIAEDKMGNLWFGTYGSGVSKYDGKSFTTYTTELGLASNDVSSIIQDNKGNIWFGTYGNGVSMNDGKSFTTYATEQGLAHNNIYIIVEDRNGNFWFGSSVGVSKYDGKTFTTYGTEQGLAHSSVRSIIQDKSGNLWFGTNGGGVSKYVGKSFTTYSTEHGLANNIVLSITEDKRGNLWFGTNGGGISILKESDLSAPYIVENGKSNFLTVNTTDGLPDNVVTGIVEDLVGNIIVGTNLGLGIILYGDLDNSIEVYNEFTGYPVRDINGGSNNGAIFCDSKGIVWAGTGSDKTALVRFEYGAIHKDRDPPKLVIQKVSIKGERVCWYDLVKNNLSKEDSTVLAQQETITYGGILSQNQRDTLKQRLEGITFDGIKKFYPLPENLVLPYKLNHITFDFLAIETDRNFRVNYQYMLKGQDDGWSPIIKKTYVTFNNIYEGDYIFLLKAQSPRGVWGTPIEYHFSVLPPWYRTWWSYTLYFTLFIYIVRSIVQLQTKKIKLRQKELQIEVDKITEKIREQNVVLEKQKEELIKKNEEKVYMMKEIHHRVKNNFQIVISLLKLQSYEVENEKITAMFEESQDRILSMARLHEQMYRSEDLKHIDIKTHFITLTQGLINEYQVGTNIKLSIDVENVDIGIKTLIPLGLIINELITNSLKHAFKNRTKGEIIVHLKHLEGIKYEMIIGDDGIGLKENEKSKGLGTELVQIFIEQLEGSLERLDVPGTQYKIEFKNIDKEK